MKAKVTVTVDSDVLDQVRRILKDPVRGRVRYGYLSALVSALLLNYVNAETAARAEIARNKTISKEDKS